MDKISDLKETILKTLDNNKALDVVSIDLANKRLAMEAGAILSVASRLEKILRRKDPLAEAVKLSRSQYVLGCLFGASKALITG